MTAEKSLEKLSQRAETGDLVAMRHLGDALRGQSGTRSQALDWWRRAGESGDADSMRRLARHEPDQEARELWRGRLAHAERERRPDLVPTEVAAAAATEGLGEPRSTFGAPGPFHGRPSRRLPPGGFAIMWVTAVLAVAAGWGGFVTRGDARVVWLTVAAALGVIAFIAVPVAASRARRAAIGNGCNWLFAGGLVHRAGDGSMLVFPWLRTRTRHESTRHESFGVHERTTYKTTLIRDDGARLVLQGDTSFDQQTHRLGEMVTAAVTRVDIPRAQEAIARGERLEFGDITIDASSITVRQKTLDWDQVERINLFHGVVRIRRRGASRTWSATPVENITNFGTLWCLMGDRAPE